VIHERSGNYFLVLKFIPIKSVYKAPFLRWSWKCIWGKEALNNIWYPSPM